MKKQTQRQKINLPAGNLGRLVAPANHREPPSWQPTDFFPIPRTHSADGYGAGLAPAQQQLLRHRRHGAAEGLARLRKGLRAELIVAGEPPGAQRACKGGKGGAQRRKKGRKTTKKEEEPVKLLKGHWKK